MATNLNVRRVERARLRDYRDRKIANDMKSLRCGQSRSLDETIDSIDRNSDGSGYFFEDHIPTVETSVTHPMLVRQNKRRPNVWMTRKRHFGARRENSYASCVRRIGRRQNERCFSKIELIGDGLHLGARKISRVGNHRHRIAAELSIGEDIDRLKWHSHERYFLGLVADHRIAL